jgi:hypothetical protein
VKQIEERASERERGVRDEKMDFFPFVGAVLCFVFHRMREGAE